MTETSPKLDRSFILIIIAVIAGLAVNAFGPLIFFSPIFRYTIDPIMARELFFPSLGYIIMILVGGSAAYSFLRKVLFPLGGINLLGKWQNEEINQALQRVKDEPEKAKPAWDLARAKLEQYFDRNLSQINYIFWLSVIVMVVGFGFILFGISQTLIPIPKETGSNIQETTAQTNNLTPALVGSIAGIITEFIGATFLFIYRSTIQQALTYTKTLERINSVGMAMQILDTISNKSKDLQDKTKAEIVKMVLSQASGLQNESTLDEQKAG